MTQTIEIRGLPRHMDEEDVIDLCEEFGLVTEIEVEHKASTGPTFWVSFQEEYEAEFAAESLDRANIDGSYVRVWLVEEDLDDDDYEYDDDDDEEDFDVDVEPYEGVAE